MDDWIKAGKITSQARDFGANLIKENKSHLKVTEEIESKIKELGGKLAFPVQISVNNVAAHFNPLVGKDFFFKEGDVCKLDLGVQVNGAIGDTAITVDLGNNSRLLKASEKALKEAVELVKPGVAVGTISELIYNIIKEEGFEPIRNLGGHGLDRYVIHSNPSIPNFITGDKTKLKEGQVIAIEPFASTGEGFVVSGPGSEIYEVAKIKQTRNHHARKILEFANEKFKGLPFSKRQLLKEFNKLDVTLGVNALLKEQIISEFNVLVEKNKNALVSQAEHTIIVGKQITTL